MKIKREGNRKRYSRRSFLKLTGAVSAAALLSAYLSRLEDLRLDSLLVPVEAGPRTFTEAFVPTTCWIGKQDCGILARVVDGRVVKLEGHPAHPRNWGTLCPKGQAQLMAFYDPYRVKAPLKRVNEKGVPGEWVEISWDEALTIVASKIKEAVARDKKLLLWQKGRSKAKKFYDSAFVKASGAVKVGHGAYCSDAGYRALEYTVGVHGVLHPDFKYCRYLLSWGWNMLNAGGNKLCWITWPQQFLEARERGMKVVAIDPWRGGLGPHTDEWLPIRPGTDLAFFLALINVLVANGYIDTEYLKKHTNAPFLVREDGYFLRIEDKEQVWDLASGSPKPHDAEGIDPALEGEYTVDGVRVKTAFQLLKEHVADYTPEWAEKVCDIPAETIRRIGRELGENALIGSTIVLDGVELPYRPVAIMGYHVAQQELGFQACRAATLIFMLLGAVGAVGGVQADFGAKLDKKRYKAWDTIEIKDPPYDYRLKNSKFYPINSVNPSLIAKVILDPARYEVDTIPEVVIIHMANPILSFVDQPVLMEAYRRFKFVVVIDPWMSETADYFADIVLPTATIEKYEGPFSVTDGYHGGYTLRVPPMKPLFQTKGDIEIYIDLCEKAGILYGPDGYIDHLNKELKLKDEYKLDLYTKPTVREIFDRWAKSAGYKEGVEFFEKRGVDAKPWPAKKRYISALDPPYGGLKHRLYGESLKRYQDAMKERGVPEIYWQDYTALPTWRQPTMEKSPPEYDLYLTSFKKVVYKQSRSTMNPLLNELEPEQKLLINPATARAKGIRDGEAVWVESHNAVTGETRRLRVKAKYTEAIRPDTVAMSHHYGFWVHPWAKRGGPTPNFLFFTGEGYVSNTADQSFHVKVRVFKG